MASDSKEQAKRLRHWANLLAGYPESARIDLLTQELAGVPDLIARHQAWWKLASPTHQLIVLELLLLQQPALNPLMAQTGLLEQWAAQLEEAERFYQSKGGLIGYQADLMDLLDQQPTAEPPQFLQPPVFDLAAEPDLYWRATRRGLEALPLCAELYPAGGAGDRLGLCDSAGEPLPVALLEFDGQTLLEAMVDDLFAREWLSYRIFGQQLTCPIAMMSSREKDNHKKLLHFCEHNDWFGRERSSMRLFMQPLVPVINPDGHWVLHGEQIWMKPGGHGVVWKLLQERGIVEWLFAHHASLLLIRQVNNPLAASDRNLLALVGIGLEEDKIMGFASCPRIAGAAEGMNVVRLQPSPSGIQAAVTNVEYTDFKKLGWRDEPISPNQPYSAFPSNTNILFLHLQKALQKLPEFPIPGLVLNLKAAPVPGEQQQRVVGRLESTMQNLADYLSTPWSPGQSPSTFESFCTSNSRLCVLSAAKKAWSPGQPVFETPQGAYLDLLRQRLEVLRGADWQVPTQHEDADRPVCLVHWHPACGPLHTIVQQRLPAGKLHPGAELRLELAEVYAERVEIAGSFLVEAHQPLGPANPTIRFGAGCGQLYLRNVRIANEGAVRTSAGWDYRANPQRVECCRIVLEGASLFSAADVTLPGDLCIRVPDGMHIEAVADAELGYRLISRPWDAESWICALDWSEQKPRISPHLETHPICLRAPA
jgi:hypothetical protein